MKIRRIRLEQFRQFRKPVEIAGLADGINLFAGPNEAGKSTIVAAVRAAFLERHRSSSVDDLRPWGDAAASPTVELDFDIAGRTYRLSKSFLGRKRCELQIGTQRLDGALAEDHLAELLGFQYAGKGASAAQHWGIPGLLWIEQGAGHDIHEPVAFATDHLRKALNTSLGEVASSGGDDVLATVEAQRNELLTPAGGTPRGALAEALKRVSSLAAELKAVDTDVATYRHKVDLLGGLRREHAADESQRPWTGFRRQEQEALARLEAIERVQGTLTADRVRLEQSEAQVQLLRGRLETFDEQEAAAATRSQAVRAARLALDDATQRVSQWSARSAAAAADFEAARSLLRRVRQEDIRISLLRELAELRQQAQATQSRLQQVEAEHLTMLALQQQAAALHIDASVLQQLRMQSRQLRELRIRRDAAATRLRFQLVDAPGVRLGDETLTGSGERLLLEATTLQLGAVGQIEISPGGADLADLGRQESLVHDALAAQLQRLGLASLDEAELRQQQHLQRAGELQATAATLKALAPRGVEALRAEALAQAARAHDVETALDKLPPPPASDGVTLPSVPEAEAAEESARRALEQIEAVLGPARVAAGNAQTTLEGAQREHLVVQALLDAPDRSTRLREANDALVDAKAALSALADSVKARSEEVAQARPDILEHDVKRYGDSARHLEQGFEDRKTALLRLEVELEGAGAQGLEERRALLAGDLEQAGRRAGQLRRRAAAADHLLQLLKAQRGALIRKLQAPLQKHLNHYLQLLFPQAHLAIDESLRPGPLTRHGPAGPESGDFEALSFGAREQMGVISRLAYADLLREAGRPTLILLDDALVHSDEQRLGLMKRVLFDAGTRHQILLFTCHPAAWRDLGVPARSIESLRLQ